MAADESALIRAIIAPAGVRGSEPLLEDLDRALVSNETHWILCVMTPKTAPATPLPNGPLPVRAFVPSEGDYQGEIIIWLSDGHISGLEFAWVTDQPPSRWPPPDEVELRTPEGPVMNLGIGGKRLQSLLIEHSVLMRLTGGHFVLVASPFTLDREGLSVAFSPEDDPDNAFEPIRQLEGEAIDEATADDAGALRIRFGNGNVLRVPPDEVYEAWNVSGPGGALVVCMPGGELAVWQPDAQSGDTLRPLSHDD